MIINLEKLTSEDFEYLKKFSRNSLNIEEARSFTLEKKYTDKFLVYLKKRLRIQAMSFLNFLKLKLTLIRKIQMKYLRILLKTLLVCLMKKSCYQTIKNNKEFTINSSNSNNIKTENLKKFEKLNSDMKAIYRNLESFIFVIC